MSRCGYDPKAGSELFGLLDRELTVRAMNHGGYFWADHPKVKERIANLPRGPIHQRMMSMRISFL